MFAARFVFALVVPGAVIFAQTMGTGTITGVITDATGAVVPGVKVTAVDLNTRIERSAFSNTSGNYVIPALQIGTYHVRAAHEGFKMITQQDVRASTWIPQ